jgi:drug/metabolite transporter (DMT)-like permease
MFAGGSAVSLVLAAVLSQSGHVTPLPAASGVLALGALALALWFLAANLALQHGAAKLPANTSSVIMITEVFFASASSLALGAANPGLREALGALMILGAALLAAVQRD